MLCNSNTLKFTDIDFMGLNMAHLAHCSITFEKKICALLTLLSGGFQKYQSDDVDIVIQAYDIFPDFSAYFSYKLLKESGY